MFNQISVFKFTILALVIKLERIKNHVIVQYGRSLEYCLHLLSTVLKTQEYSILSYHIVYNYIISTIEEEML